MTVVMRSDQRFHPLTVLFALGGELRAFMVPILFATFTARSRGGDAQLWFLIFLIPSLCIAVARYWVSTYRYAETELVVRTGLIFRNERHIPYARIQSVDARQNVFHRFFNVVEVKVQTGTGGEIEATLSVLPMTALDEMRARVFEGRDATAVDTPTAAPEDAILRLSLRETALSGLLDNRGWVVIGAASGLLWELGLFERFEHLPQTSWTVVAAIAAGLFIVSPILSVVWAVVRLHGFTLRRRDAELFSEYGALTRVTATIPLRRVQAVTIVRSPGYLLTKRAAIRVNTAGGGAAGGSAERDWIAPIIPHDEVPAFVTGLLPDVRLAEVAWQSADPRAGTRRTRRAVYRAMVLGAVSSWWMEPVWALILTLVLAIWGVIAARQFVRHLAWARTDDAVYFTSGWLWRSTTIVPVPKMQSVSLQESPFDRRWGMASVAVDTAGAGGHPIDVPYLPRLVAEDLRTTLAAQAAATTYRW